jgi:putative lipoic acid-binding regulatory protein
MNQPIIQYPCEWSYRIIGTDEQALREAASASVEGLEHRLSVANQSQNKSYLSMNLTVVVETQAIRDRIFKLLENHAAVRLIL